MSIDRLTTGDMLCSYNGVTWGPSAYTSAFTVKPIPDPANRTVMLMQVTMTVVETIADTTVLDPVILDKIAKLERNGGRLRYEGRGFGVFAVNLAGAATQKDAKWGPWTREVSCKATGAGTAVELSWTVEFTVICPDEIGNAGTIVQFTYEVGYDIDREGYTTRNYQATLTIAQTRKTVNDKTLQASADVHREKMVPALLAGFRREEQTYKLDLSKCTITATVRDVQMPGNIPPLGVVDGSIEHTWQSMELFKWAGSISATFNVDRVSGTPLNAVDAFLEITRVRLNEARTMVIDAAAIAGLAPVPAGAAAGDPVVIYVRGASASEPNVLGRLQTKLGFNYMAVGCSFAEIIRAGGLWRPVTGTGLFPFKGWKEWVASIPTALTPRGHAFLKFDPKEDSLVDACISTPEPKTMQPIATGQGVSPFGTVLRSRLFRSFPAPTPKNSWIHYTCLVTIHPDLGRTVGHTLPDQPIAGHRSPGSAWDVMRGVQTVAPAPGSPFPPLAGLLEDRSNSGGEAFVQQRRRPALYVTITGQALRGGWQIPVPELVEVNGARPTLVGEPIFRTGITAHTQVPIVYADWRLTYLFTGEGGVPPRTVPVPPNPFLA